MEEEDFGIRDRRTLLKMCIEAMEPKLDAMMMIEDELRQEGVDDLSVRLQELKKDHQHLKDGFNAFTAGPSTSSVSVQDSSKRLSVLQSEHELVNDKCSNLMSEFEARRKEREVMSNVSDGEEPSLLLEQLKQYADALEGYLNDPDAAGALQVYNDCCRYRDELHSMIETGDATTLRDRIENIREKFRTIKYKVRSTLDIGVFTAKSRGEMEANYQQHIKKFHECNMRLAPVKELYFRLRDGSERSLLERQKNMLEQCQNDSLKHMYWILSEYYNSDNSIKAVKGLNMEEMGELTNKYTAEHVATEEDVDRRPKLKRRETVKQQREINKICQEYFASSASKVDYDLEIIQTRMNDYIEQRENQPLTEETEGFIEEAHQRQANSEDEQRELQQLTQQIEDFVEEADQRQANIEDEQREIQILAQEIEDFVEEADQRQANIEDEQREIQILAQQIEDLVEEAELRQGNNEDEDG